MLCGAGNATNATVDPGRFVFYQEKPPALHTQPSADQFAGALWSEEVTVVIHQAVYLLTVLLDCGDSNSRNGE